MIFILENGLCDSIIWGTKFTKTCFFDHPKPFTESFSSESINESLDSYGRFPDTNNSKPSGKFIHSILKKAFIKFSSIYTPHYKQNTGLELLTPKDYSKTKTLFSNLQGGVRFLCFDKRFYILLDILHTTLQSLLNTNTRASTVILH